MGKLTAMGVKNLTEPGRYSDGWLGEGVLDDILLSALPLALTGRQQVHEIAAASRSSASLNAASRSGAEPNMYSSAQRAKRFPRSWSRAGRMAVLRSHLGQLPLLHRASEANLKIGF